MKNAATALPKFSSQPDPENAMTKIPKAETTVSDGLPFVDVQMRFERPDRSDIDYTIKGNVDEDTAPVDLPIPPEKRIEGTFNFDLSGKVFMPDEWAGYHCKLMINNLGISAFDHGDELSPTGFIGDGWCELKAKRVLIRLTIPATMVRDLIDLWDLFSDNSTIIPELRCQLVNLHEGEQFGEPHVSYRIIRFYSVPSWEG